MSTRSLLGLSLLLSLVTAGGASAQPSCPGTTSTISCGDTLSGDPGDCFSFSGAAGETVGGWIVEGFGWCLYDPSDELMSCASTNGMGNDSLPTTGTYTITTFDQLGGPDPPYNFTLHFLSEGSTCGAPIGCGETASSDISITADVDAYTFTGDAGDVVGLWIDVDPQTDETWCIYGPDGAFTNSCAGVNGMGSLSLPSSGTYTVTVFDSGTDETPSYNLTMQYLSAGATCGAPLECDEAVSGTLDPVGDTDAFTFTSVVGSVAFDIEETAGTFDEGWCLHDPDGDLVICSSNGSAHAELGQYGTYTLYAFDSGGDDSGSYDLTARSGVCSPKVPAMSVKGHLVLGGLLLLTAVGALGYRLRS